MRRAHPRTAAHALLAFALIAAANASAADSSPLTIGAIRASLLAPEEELVQPAFPDESRPPREVRVIVALLGAVAVGTIGGFGLWALGSAIEPDQTGDVRGLIAGPLMLVGSIAGAGAGAWLGSGITGGRGTLLPAILGAAGGAVVAVAALLGSFALGGSGLASLVGPAAGTLVLIGAVVGTEISDSMMSARMGEVTFVPTVAAGGRGIGFGLAGTY